MTDSSADLLDLLRLACGQGKMRLNVWHGAQNGHQANLANSGDGWTVDHDRDPLEAITKVLRIRFGKQLERQRAGDPDASNVVHIAHRDASRPPLTEAKTGEELEHVIQPTPDDYCACGSHNLFKDCCANGVDDDEVFEAVQAVLVRRGIGDVEAIFIAAAVIDELFDNPQPNLHEVEMTTAGAVGIGACRYCADTGQFYGDAELGPCGCPATPVADDDFDIDALIG